MSKEPEQRALIGSARLSGSTTVEIFSAPVRHTTCPTLYIHECDHRTKSMSVVAGSPHCLQGANPRCQHAQNGPCVPHPQLSATAQTLAYAVVMHMNPRDCAGCLKVGGAQLTFCLLDPALFCGTPMTETSGQVLDAIRCARNSIGR